MKVIIESASKLTADQKQQLTDKLHQELSSDDRIIFRIQPALIGGLRVISPTKVIDLSIKSRLTQLKQSLLK